MNTSELWNGSFGNAYTKRNRVEWESRIPTWRTILAWTNPRSILEVGCNAGWNLMALREIDPSLNLQGIDVNTSALEEAQHNGLSVSQKDAYDIGLKNQFDLVFTAGLLIHIPPVNLWRAMDAIVVASMRHVVAMDYAADE